MAQLANGRAGSFKNYGKRKTRMWVRIPPELQRRPNGETGKTRKA